MSKLTDVQERVLAGTATEVEMHSLGEDEVYALRADPDQVQYKFVPDSMQERADDDGGGGSEGKAEPPVEHVASTEEQDRYGDRILVAGWDLAAFKTNPVLLWAHMSHSLPIGRVVKAIKGFTKKGVRALLTQSLFHGEDFEFAALVERLVRSRKLPAVSVGFRAIDTYRPKDEKEREKLGLGKWGMLFKKSELVELSVVPVPANASALMKSLDADVEAGLYERELVQRFEKECPLTEDAAHEQLRSRVRSFVDMGREAAVLPAEPIDEPELEDVVHELDAQLVTRKGAMEVVIDAASATELVARMAEMAQHMNTLGETV